VLDTYRDPRYLPLRRALVADPTQSYWRTDPHWTSAGGATYSTALARRLSPRVAAAQRLAPTELTILGLLNDTRGLTTTETAPGVRARGTRVTTTPGSTDWPGLPALVTDHAWSSAPARRTYRGHTLLIGDSFTQYALGTLRPLFRHGRFLWTEHYDEATLLAALEESQTVVIEVAQFLVQRSPLVDPGLRTRVAATLGRERR
jgi:hypothetical protein